MDTPSAPVVGIQSAIQNLGLKQPAHFKTHVPRHLLQGELGNPTQWERLELGRSAQFTGWEFDRPHDGSTSQYDQSSITQVFTISYTQVRVHRPNPARRWHGGCPVSWRHADRGDLETGSTDGPDEPVSDGERDSNADRLLKTTRVRG